MSSSSLWLMDKKFCGHIEKEYGNSWLFTPVSRDILMWKYCPEKAYNSALREKVGFLTESMFDKTLFSRLNEKINHSENQADRVVWELGNQQVFFSKDKTFVAESIREFLNSNKDDALTKPHISARWNEMASDIENIPDQYPYFVHKNTSCDDGVEWWFWDGEKDRKRSLKKCDRPATEFVIVDNGQITNFISNLEYLAS